MTTTELSHNIFVPTVECGSAIVNTPTGRKIGFNHEIRKAGGIDTNMCFYTCVLRHISTRMMAHIKNKLSFQKNIRYEPYEILIKLKKYLTSSLPFANIFTGRENPALVGNPCDHRVIQRAASTLRMTVYIFNSGNKIYKFTPEYTDSDSELFVFFHRNHYKLIVEESSQEKIRTLYDEPERIEEFCKPYVKKEKTYKRAVQNK